MQSPQADQLTAWSEFIPGPLEKIQHDWGKVQLFIKRLDLIRSWASGNKYYKLKYHLQEVIENEVKVIVSKGGMFSNHLEALARACYSFEIKCVCVIRSFKEDENNPSIKNLRLLNAELHFVSPDEYDSFNEVEARNLHPGSHFIQEGGFDEKGIRGSSEIISELKEHSPTHVVIAGGSMTTAVGLLSSAEKNTNIIIIPAWKGCNSNYISDILLKYNIHPECNWELWREYHFGGFGKYNTDLANFMYSFSEKTNIPLDPVYTGKMMYAIKEKIQSGYFRSDDEIICIHTGGLQGVEGFRYRDPAVWKRYSDFISL